MFLIYLNIGSRNIGAIFMSKTRLLYFSNDSRIMLLTVLSCEK
jgi:hypothetical protein